MVLTVCPGMEQVGVRALNACILLHGCVHWDRRRNYARHWIKIFQFYALREQVHRK